MGNTKRTSSVAENQMPPTDGSPAGVTGHLPTKVITATEWGGNHIESIKKIATEQSDVDINWELFTGGALTIVPKIKAKWPHPGIDLVAGYNASFQQIAREGWAEPVTAENVPHIVDIPRNLLVKDSAGNIINIPRTLTALFWFCREDIVPFPITRLDDLLDPRLKGKICFPALTSNSCLQLVSLALHKGGDEKNMEPAWDFVKALARSGNIGCVARTCADTIQSLTSGETCITCESSTVAVDLARQFNIRYLIKMDPKSTGFWTYLFYQGWSVLKGGHADAAFKFANFVISPENNAEFNRLVGGIPANVKSKVSDEAKPFVFSEEEMERYTYTPDWSHLTEQSDAWIERWEREIAPLL
ncbi:extracellular solute-binding protein [Bradyrhizobium sp. INPA03-11B]|uniref:ABC transporter substrate-binding protein n=1 Tax=Bradyrhizobium sp. INPA03-11B TaxID=418598 RepID=UPI00338FBA32